jgi:polysaccharide biosynthesis/export protein
MLVKQARKSNMCLLVAFVLFYAALSTSCTSTKKVVYFNDLTDSVAIASIKTAKANFESPIQKNDQLWITVGGSNIEDLTVLNSGNGLGVGGGNGNIGTSGNGAAIGYLVESDGTIKVPLLGKVKAEGLSRLQLEANLTELFKEYTRNPVVNVRFLNYTYSILGEVTRSGKYQMQTERTTLLDAISQAGDLTDLGRRENIAVIREENGERKVGRVNLLSKDIFNSPYFYLRNNDIVYIEPVKARFISRSGIPQYVSIVAIGLSMILTAVNIAGK